MGKGGPASPASVHPRTGIFRLHPSTSTFPPHARTVAGDVLERSGSFMFAASVSARSVIVLTCTATAMLTAWIIAAAPVVGTDEGRVRVLVGQVRPLGDGTIRSWVR